MIACVCWLWGSRYPDGHVIRLRNMVARNYKKPHRFVCITDRRAIAGVTCVPMPQRPPGAARESIRLWLFSAHARKAIGDDMVNLDIDMVVTGDLEPLLADPVPFKIWQSDSVGPHGFALNPSLMRVRGTGMTQLWLDFARDSAGMMDRAKRAGWTGTEQAIIGHHFRKSLPPLWTAADGVTSTRVLRGQGVKDVLPQGVRLVSFHGKADPATDDSAWVKANWR